MSSSSSSPVHLFPSVDETTENSSVSPSSKHHSSPNSQGYVKIVIQDQEDAAETLPSTPDAAKRKTLPRRRALHVFCCFSCCIILFYIIGSLLLFPFFPPYTYTCRRRYMEGEWSNTAEPTPEAHLNNSFAFDSSLESVPYNKIHQIGTHNSYHTMYWTGIFIGFFRYEMGTLQQQLEKGVRHFELDVHFVNNEWLTYHIRYLDWSTNCFCLYECLSIFKNWSDQNPGHFPLSLWIEPKQVLEMGFGCRKRKIEILHEVFAEVWGKDRIYTPATLQGNYTTLSEAIEAKGWPTVGELKGKFMVVLDLWYENANCRDAATEIVLKEGTTQHRDDGLFFIRTPTYDYHYSSVVEYKLYQEEEIEDTFKKGYLTRCVTDDKESEELPLNYVAVHDLTPRVEPKVI